MINAQLYRDLLQKDGYEKYIRKSIEELAELQLALLHFSDAKTNRYHIAIEIADVKSQLEKLEELYMIEDVSSKHYNEKLRELEEYVYEDPNFRL